MTLAVLISWAIVAAGVLGSFAYAVSVQKESRRADRDLIMENAERSKENAQRLKRNCLRVSAIVAEIKKLDPFTDLPDRLAVIDKQFPNVPSCNDGR